MKLGQGWAQDQGVGKWAGGQKWGWSLQAVVGEQQAGLQDQGEDWWGGLGEASVLQQWLEPQWGQGPEPQLGDGPCESSAPAGYGHYH